MVFFCRYVDYVVYREGSVNNKGKLSFSLAVVMFRKSRHSGFKERFGELQRILGILSVKLFKSCCILESVNVLNILIVSITRSYAFINFHKNG